MIANRRPLETMRLPCAWMIVPLALLLSACSPAGPRGHAAPQPFTDFDTLSIAQSPCLFNCPVFEVEIFSDGRVRHSGPAFEQTGGAHEMRIDTSGLTHIAKALRDARLDEMRTSYQDEKDGCESRLTDLWTTSLRLSRDGGQRSTTVDLYAGCLGPTVPTGRINALIKAVDQVTGTGALLEQRKKPGRPDEKAAEPATQT